jgi:Phosphopantetheine attachment site
MGLPGLWGERAEYVGSGEYAGGQAARRQQAAGHDHRLLVARLATQLGVKISLRTFMSNSTVRAIGDYLDRQES